MQNNLYWAYLHINNSIHVKRYFDRDALDDADESPFVQRRTETFEAKNYDEAEIIAKQKLNIS